MKAIVVALSAVLLSCSEQFPPIESKYQLGGAIPECRGTMDERWIPADGPAEAATEYVCGWERVRVDGADSCAAWIVFGRASASAPWTVTGTFRTTATECT